MAEPARSLSTLFAEKETAIGRDLKLNLKRILEQSSLPRGDALLACLAASTAVGFPSLAAYARDELATMGYPPDQIQEAAESAAILGMLNVYGRYRAQMEEETPAGGFRVTALARPSLGRPSFEALGFVLSVLHGCPNCLRAHRRALLDTGVPPERLHDLARLAAVVRGLKDLDQARPKFRNGEDEWILPP